MAQTFYIIGKDFPTNGLGSIVSVVLSQVDYALQKGYIPVVDLKNFDNIYFKDGRQGIDNAWEYFFEQPCGYGLEDIPQDAKVIYFEKGVKGFSEAIRLTVQNHRLCPTSAKSIALYQTFRKYFRLNAATQHMLQTRFETLVGNQSKLLGVLARGTDYGGAHKPKGHPIQPTAEEIFDVLKEFDASGSVFVATEDADIFEAFQARYQTRLYAIDQHRYRASEKALAEEPVSGPNHHYHLALDYLAAIYILSKCDCVLSGWNNGLFLAYLLNENIPFVHLFDLGYWGDKNHPLPKRPWWVKSVSWFIFPKSKRKAFRNRF